VNCSWDFLEQAAEISAEARRRTILTMEALDVMCRERNCPDPQVEQCQAQKNAVEWIISLASKGFTVTEIQCTLGKAPKPIDSDLWEHLCAPCLSTLPIKRDRHVNTAKLLKRPYLL